MQLFIFFITTFSILSTDARIHPGYSQESSCNSTDLHPSWMSTIPDSRPLQLISIPGTHDSLARFGTTKFMYTNVYETQTMPLKEQLEAGIRAFDVRCRHVDNQCHIYHQTISQQITLGGVLDICQMFLKQNPSEVILMRVKDQEQAALKTNRTFEETFVAEYWSKYQDLFWLPKDIDVDSSPTLPIGQVRGKVVILQYFQATKHYGFPFENSGHHMSRWKQFSRATLYLKWTQIREQLYKANSSASLYFDSGPFGSSLPFYTNWLSGSLFAKPYFVASGHQDWGTDGTRHTCSKHYFGSDNVFEEFPRSEVRTNSWGLSYKNVLCEGTNVMTYERLKNEWFRFVGMIFADFPGCGLVQMIIEINKHF